MGEADVIVNAIKLNGVSRADVVGSDVSVNAIELT